MKQVQIQPDEEVLARPLDEIHIDFFRHLLLVDCPPADPDSMEVLAGEAFCRPLQDVDGRLRNVDGQHDGIEWTDDQYMTNSYSFDSYLFGDVRADYELFIDVGARVAAVRPTYGYNIVATMDMQKATWRELIAWCRAIWRLYGADSDD